jgi:tetratricopeptide (TPR) repeat protein
MVANQSFSTNEKFLFFFVMSNAKNEPLLIPSDRLTSHPTTRSPDPHSCPRAQFHQLQRRDADQAQAFYAEALKMHEAHDASLLAMARLQCEAGDVDRALQTAQMMLRLDAGHEEASAMLSDLMFRKGDVELAIGSFKTLLERKADHYSVLHRLMLLLRRAGRLPDAQRYLKAAAKSSPRAEFDAGLHYCQVSGPWRRWVVVVVPCH